MASRFFIEGEEPARNADSSEADLRARMAEMIQHTGFRDKLNPETANIEVLKTLEGPVFQQFQEAAARKGQLVCEEYQDFRGQTRRRYHGSAKDEIAQSFAAPGITARIAEVVSFDGKNYLKDQVPNHVKARMYARSLGAE